MLLCIDESGNTQEIIALGMVAIPDKEIEKINQLFTLRPTDPDEIQKLWSRISDKSLKPREEFKYSDFRNAERATGLGIYKEFLQEKLKVAAETNIEGYFSTFSKPNNNAKRLWLIAAEAAVLIDVWAGKNQTLASSRDLQIVVDQQIFNEPQIFKMYERRNEIHCTVYPKSQLDETRFYGGTKNKLEIIEREILKYSSHCNYLIF